MFVWLFTWLPDSRLSTIIFIAFLGILLWSGISLLRPIGIFVYNIMLLYKFLILFNISDILSPILSFCEALSRVEWHFLNYLFESVFIILFIPTISKSNNNNVLLPSPIDFNLNTFSFCLLVIVIQPIFPYSP